MIIREPSSRLHIRNRHTGRYDFDTLTQLRPELRAHLKRNPTGESTLDFSDPVAVRLLNGALLQQFYGIAHWEIPPDYLCPPIPGRADVIHSVADLLAGSNGGEIPRGPDVRVLDIGVGASCIYPIIGHCEYGWSFVGSDIDEKAIESARKIVAANPQLKGAIEIQLQPRADHIFAGLLTADERFDLTVCNPPFHASKEEAQFGSRRKWENLGKIKAGEAKLKNFGGQSNELWCQGGELSFIRRMIDESADIPEQCMWFTTVVSRDVYLDAIHEALERVAPKDVRTLNMAQGQKKSRIVAWTFVA